MSEFPTVPDTTERRLIEWAVLAMLLAGVVFCVVGYARRDVAAYERCTLDLRRTAAECDALPGSPARAKFNQSKGSSIMEQSFGPSGERTGAANGWFGATKERFRP